MKTKFQKLTFLITVITIFSVFAVTSALASGTDIQALSETLADGFYDMSEEIDISGYSSITSQILSNAMLLTFENHPDIVWCNYSYSYTASKFFPSYSMTAEEANKVKKVIDDEYKSIINGMPNDLTDAEKIVWVNDYMCLNYEYDTTFTANHTHDILGVMMNKTGVCDSYSKAFLYVMNRLGIECKRAISDEMNHAWNYVKVDSEWYHVDVTWNDPIQDKLGYVGHSYLLVSDNDIRSDTNPHYGWDDIGVTCTSDKYKNADWTNTTRNIVFDDENMYYIESNGKINSVNRKTGITTTLYTNTGIWFADVESGSIWPGCYSNLYLYDGIFYFNDANTIYSMNKDGTNVKALKAVNSPVDYIYGMVISDNVISYGLAKSPNEKIVSNASYEIPKKAPAPGTMLCGDVTGDGVINSQDAVILAQYLAEWSTDAKLNAADTTADGKISSSDAVLLAQYLAEWNVTLGSAA